MIAVSYMKESTSFLFSTKKVTENLTKTVYFRVSVFKLTFLWMDNKKAKEMLTKEVGGVKNISTYPNIIF